MTLLRLLVLWPPFSALVQQSAPGIPGAEAALSGYRTHYGILSDRPHYAATAPRPHYIVPEE